MQYIKAHIESRARMLEQHGFFATFAQPEPDLERAMAFAPMGMFWVLAFQDIIRINVERAHEPFVRALLQQHQAEDSGHEDWFFEDVEGVYGKQEFGARWLFSPANREVREVSYALASEVYMVTDDRLRLVLVEALEAAANVYFAHFSRFLVASGHAGRLKYFAGVHLQEESAHQMHENDVAVRIAGIVLSEEGRITARAMVDRMFDAFGRLADSLLSLRSRGQ